DTQLPGMIAYRVPDEAPYLKKIESHGAQAPPAWTACPERSRRGQSPHRRCFQPFDRSPCERSASGCRTAGAYCCSTTWSPSFSPLRISVTEPLDSPTFTATLRVPSFLLLSGTSTEAFLSLS